MSHERFDVAVVGKGLIGAATARHLCVRGAKVAVIGPDEPVSPAQAEVFASHYDQGRVFRRIGQDAVWTRLNAESYRGFVSLQEESGVSFLSGAGCLLVTPPDDSYTFDSRALGDEWELPYKLFSSMDECHAAHPGFRFPADSLALFEPAPAGHLNPMALIEAQLKAFSQRGGTIIREVVSEIDWRRPELSLKLSSGASLEARQVVIATGVFGNFFSLLPKKLKWQVESETVLLAETAPPPAQAPGSVSAQVQAHQSLHKLPSLLYEVHTETYNGVYTVSPVMYPDGRWYFKMGCNVEDDQIFTELSQVQGWFREGRSEMQRSRLEGILGSFLPDFQPLSTQTKRCVIVRTVHGKPYIGAVEDPLSSNRLFVAAGGNGYGAMSSDGLGQVAASLVHTGAMPDGYNPSCFAPVWEEEITSAGE